MKNHILLCDNLKMAKSISTRTLGLMFRSHLEKGEGLMLEPCNSVHTCFMNFPIDVIFLNSDNVVVDYRESMKPWRITKLVWSARKVLELEANVILGKVSIGDRLEVFSE